MISWPDLGTRVTLRYRRPPGSVPPLTDAVGHLLAIEPVVRVRTKTNTIVEIAPSDVVVLRVLSDAPVRTADIRNLERAAAAAAPGAEEFWLDGWLLRGHGATPAANSAVPLDLSASVSAIPAIVAWYRARGLPPRLLIPDRLLRVDLVSVHTENVLVREVNVEPRDVTDHAPAVVTDAPDGTRWVGLPAALTRDRFDDLLAWGAAYGATRAYVCVADTDSAAARALGFGLHHRRRYVLPPENRST
ncbi:hypothetical protein A5634_25990 [Mycobacterium asiaticum]|uniref:GCN5 family acetyltransferase n=1 Tax=Mycobacterium asiaticum TaxID=1790 RepID=A0A1A3NXR8_MYCAS|nr:hypothetical protein [Mycobacterium asiaticum]OBK25814.1 hypothetical protein A5634_25990 [Mycobacterium asiaticum]